MDRLRMLVFCIVAPMGSLVAAEPPRVSFDMPYAVACRDVTPSDYSNSHPGHKPTEARLEVSSLLTAGQEEGLAESFIRVERPQGTATIADYRPQREHD